MLITQEEEVDRQVVLRMELDDEDTGPYIERAYRKVRPLVVYPGFRKGKAPRHIVLQLMGKEALLQEVLDEMLNEMTSKAITEQDLEPGGLASLEDVSLTPVTFKATVPLKPKVDLGNYRSIRIELDVPEISEENIQQRLEQLQNSMTSWEPVDRPVQMGDMVTMTATGSVESDTVLNETDTVYMLDEDAQLPFPGFAQALVGAEMDSPTDFDLAIPDDRQNEQVAGKTAHISVTVSDVKERILPEIDEEFAMSVGEGYDSLQALREQIESELKTEAETASQQKLQNDALESLIDGASVEIPPLLIDYQVNYMLNEQAQILTQAGVSLGDYLRSIGTTEFEVRQQFRGEAENRITRSIVLSNLGEVEQIEVSDDAVEDRIQTALEQNLSEGDPPPEITDEIRNSVRDMLYNENILERLTAIAKGEAPDLPCVEPPDTAPSDTEPSDTESPEQDQTQDPEQTQPNNP